MEFYNVDDLKYKSSTSCYNVDDLEFYNVDDLMMVDVMQLKKRIETSI